MPEVWSIGLGVGIHGMSLTTCRTHTDTPLKDGACPKCGWRPVSGKGVPQPAKVFKRPPEPEEYRRIRRGVLRATYQCARCNRNHHDFAIVECAGEYFCSEHYRDRRLELAYAEGKPYPDEWREVAIAALTARHPERARGETEPRSAYQQRMIGLAKRLARHVGIRYADKA